MMNFLVYLLMVNFLQGLLTRGLRSCTATECDWNLVQIVRRSIVPQRLAFSLSRATYDLWHVFGKALSSIVKSH
jgi:hypothetical protein